MVMTPAKYVIELDGYRYPYSPSQIEQLTLCIEQYECMPSLDESQQRIYLFQVATLNKFLAGDYQVTEWS